MEGKYGSTQMEWIFGLIQILSSVVFACTEIWGLAVLTALNPFLSLLLFVMACVEFAVLHCQSVRQGSAAVGCMKQIFKPANCSGLESQDKVTNVESISHSYH